MGGRFIRSLAVEGCLKLTGPRGAISVQGERDRVVVRAESVAACVALLRCGPVSPLRRSRLRSLERALGFAGLTVDFELGKRRLLRLGQQARPGLLSRLTGLRSVQLGWAGLGLGALALMRAGGRS